MFTAASLAWSEEKDRWLRMERGLSFDAVREAVEEGRILDVLDHPNTNRFGHQRILVVEIGGYACAVPFVVDGEILFLKTIYRSRELQKRYLGGSRQ